MIVDNLPVLQKKKKKSFDYATFPIADTIAVLKKDQ